MKQGEQISRHFYGCMTDRIAGNQTGISILLESLLSIYFTEQFLLPKAVSEGYPAFFVMGKRSGHVCKIAFWGMEESCHITENMIVMSWLLAKIRPAHSIFVHRENGWQCIFSGGKDRILFADCGCGRDKKTQNSLKSRCYCRRDPYLSE